MSREVQCSQGQVNRSTDWEVGMAKHRKKQAKHRALSGKRRAR